MKPVTKEDMLRVIKWYANPKNWTDDDWCMRSVFCGVGEYGEGGKRARKLLERIKKEGK